jgi:heme exporter protein A
MTLSVKDVAVERGGLPILSDVNFEVAPGTALILRGPNGVGKTTLLRALAGLQPVLAGRVSYDEGEGAYASHADGVKTALSVKENLEFWAAIYGQTVSPDIYDWFDLSSLIDRSAGTLSAGQKRRLGLARLGVIKQKVLFLDEPTVSLDAESVRRFAKFLVNEHLGRGGIAVIATHVDLGIDAPELSLEQFVASQTSAGADEAFL